WRILQIKNKNADIIPIRSSREYNELIGIKDTRFISTPSLSIYFLFFNTRKKPFNKLEVRKAIAHLINKKGVVKSIFQKLAINATTPLPPHIFGFNKKINDYSFDINKAKNLLEKAGYKKGFATTLHSSIGPIFLNNIVNRFILNAKKINIKINKKKLSFTELREVANRGEHNLLILGWTAGPDPDLFLFPHFSLKKGNFNRSFYNNPVLVEILEKARETFSWPERKKLYLKAQEIIHRDVPCVPLFHLYIVKAFNSKIKNLKLNQLGFIIFKDLYYKKK
ncbi:MAG: hypothetical protein KAT17_09320, partial [Candidatus Aminicenantes bacterium]|nr:hypothetical protein [Candidatus Aminicenantes bacterium]